MAAVDHLIAVLRKNQDPQMPPDCVGRFLCTKFTWRGKYQRVLCITPSAVVTQHPDNLAITNTWSFKGEPDIEAVSVGPGKTEFSLSARKDNRVGCRCLATENLSHLKAEQLGSNHSHTPDQGLAYGHAASSSRIRLQILTLASAMWCRAGTRRSNFRAISEHLC